MLRDLKDVGEEDIVFTIKTRVVSGEGGVPDIGLRHLMLQSSLVAKVCVLDVLHQPVLGPLELLDVHRGRHLVEPGAEDYVLLLVLRAVVEWEVHRVTEFFLLSIEVVSYQFLKFVNKVLVVEVTLNGPHRVKESNMLLVHLDILKGKVYYKGNGNNSWINLH